MNLAMTTGDLLGVLPATADVRLTIWSMPSLPTEFLRHTLATLAYRAEKAFRDPPPGFEAFRAAPQSRPALAIVAHMGDLMEWGERMALGERRWEAVPQPSWDAAVDRFFRALSALDGILAARGTEPVPVEVIIQGPIADALTHVGQLAMMRGMAAAPVRPESYASTRIAIGRVGRDQDTERREFDGDASPQGQS
jgi:hypothetical protein